jgi:hypothetical protein
MKKILTIAAIGAISSVAQAQELTWDVLCIKQGPARGFDARSLKPGNTARSLRALPAAAATGYPAAARSNPSQAKVAEQSDISGDMNFISLGFGGQIVLRSSDWFYNGPGNDFSVFETTWGDPKCRPANSEQALIEVSEDGFNWVVPGVISNGPGGPYNTCYNGSFDIAPLFKAQFVRITDRTNPDWKVGGDGVDAYDVDGVVANYTDGGGGDPEGPVVCDYSQGVASQFASNSDGLNFPGRGIVAQRKNFANANINEAGFPVAALGNPGLRDSGPNAGVYNFWSIGFGGYACLKLPNTVFNGPGADFYAFETTWNNQPCPNYNEKAWVSVSTNGITYSNEILICKDALGIPGTSPAIDLSSFPGFFAVNYIKFRDASSPADFGGGADSYDIDNILVAQAPVPTPGIPFIYSCDNVMSVRQALPFGASTFMEGGVPEEMFALELLGASVVTDKLSFQATIAEEGGYSYSIRSATGQEAMSGDFAGTLYSTPVAEIATSKLNNGVYFLTLSSATSKETVKFVKN